MTYRTATSLLVLAFASAAPAAAQAPEAVEFFEARVRPVLVEHCAKCHSARATKVKGGLLLDSRETVLKGGDSGPAVVPGLPDKSRLIEAVRYENVELRMPPRGKLPERAIADLTTWVKQGAVFPGGTAVAPAATLKAKTSRPPGWAFAPLTRPVVPACSEWGRDPIDAFVADRLRKAGLTPSPPADRATLLRRVTFDLVGLPATPEEIAVFENDRGPDAFAHVVDRLLASPHFGERWGRHWLDLVRYAESRGHESDYTLANAFQYRDYVIRALNADVPYDQFVTEHLAGDLLEQPRLHPEQGFNESVLGTGFWFLGEEVHSPVDVRQDQADRFDNRIDVMTKTFLGLTVACARCHDHKFDPITQKDYYALLGFLESSGYRQVRFEALEQNRRVAAELEALRERARPAILRAFAEAWRPAVAARAWERNARSERRGVSPPVASRLARYEVTGGLTPRRSLDVVVDYGRASEREWFPDGVGFGRGPVRPGDVRLGSDPSRPIECIFDRGAAEADPFWADLKPTADAQPDPGALGAIAHNGRTIRTPTFTVRPGKVYYLVRGSGHAYAAVAQHTLIEGPLHKRLVLPLRCGEHFRWVPHDLSAYPGQPAYVEFTAKEGADFAVAMVVQAEQEPPPPHRLEAAGKGLEDRFAEVVARLASDQLAGSDVAPLAAWMLEHPERFPPPDAVAIERVAGDFFADQARLRSQVRTESHLALAMLDGSGVDERVFIRGSPRILGEPAPRRFLEVLAGARPLDIPRGSGRGIVGSVDNFGALGEAPTHPELLDHLATRFVREGWSLKRLIRAVVLSDTYQMMSRPDGKGDAVDPQNLLLHRARVRRLEGEAIRDALLAVAGRLDRGMYGPGIPIHLTPFLDGRGKPASGPLDGAGRRSVYLAVRRNFLSPFLVAFDTPTPFSTVGRRTVSNVPAQALILMNDPFVHAEARRWGERVRERAGTAEQKIDWMYRAAFGRPAEAGELKACLEFLGLSTEYSDRKATGPSAPSAAPDWPALAHVLINAKEFIYLH